MAKDAHKDPIETTVDGAPVHKAYPLPSTDVYEKIPHAGIPRANLAPSAEHPNGSSDIHHKNYSVLQQHIAFFDPDNDGVVYPWNTYSGFRRMGFVMSYSFLAMLFIHLNMAYPTQTSWIPNPALPIFIANIHKVKHGSDTDIYDSEGRFRPDQFEELFSRFGKTRKDALTATEVRMMLSHQRRPWDIFGWIACFLEYFTLWLLCGEGSGFGSDSYITKENIRRQYDGTLFFQMEAKENARKQQKVERSEKAKKATTNTAHKKVVEPVQHMVGKEE
ncbi:plant seed peroxygenase [Synchytrium microbalum]|uniref:Plant seed peroxygenase n=1 Tax=Synchytrium microbalum TaxID=1806994 RepID=A0A507CA33_9FUNG|nr:plant seed peroxygenase [Synchytrium microbalum]TPX34856.1 plant seed peroxygenase [Synchytrium microbalum]